LTWDEGVVEVVRPVEHTLLQLFASAPGGHKRDGTVIPTAEVFLDARATLRELAVFFRERYGIPQGIDFQLIIPRFIRHYVYVGGEVRCIIPFQGSNVLTDVTLEELGLVNGDTVELGPISPMNGGSRNFKNRRELFDACDRLLGVESSIPGSSRVLPVVTDVDSRREASVIKRREVEPKRTRFMDWSDEDLDNFAEVYKVRRPFAAANLVAMSSFLALEPAPSAPAAVLVESQVRNA
jgi:hypothetical protein